MLSASSILLRRNAHFLIECRTWTNSSLEKF